MRTKRLPLRDRVAFALRHWLPPAHDIDKVVKVLNKKHPDAEFLSPRELGKLVRATLSNIWDLGGGR